MSLNLELKIKVNSHQRIRNILKNNRAKCKGILKQKDVYFKTEGCLLKLRMQADSNELIKYKRDESGKKRWSNYEILTVDGHDIEKYFKSFLKTEVIVEKRRELWVYKSTRIHLDTVKKLGLFLELETLVLNGKKEAELQFKEVIKLLQLQTDSQILASYRNLMLNSR